MGAPGQVIENRHFTGDVGVWAADVVLRNVRIDGYLTIYGTGVQAERISALGLGVSGAKNLVVRHSQFGGGAGDGIHVTSARSRVENVLLESILVHSPRPTATSHYDGLQVRGVSGLSMRCSSVQLGAFVPQHNAAIYIEPANGGNERVLIDSNWLSGGGFTVRAKEASVSILNNKISSEYKWGPCLAYGPFLYAFNLDGDRPSAPCAQYRR